jgi:hypothetical protein
MAIKKMCCKKICRLNFWRHFLNKIDLDKNFMMNYDELGFKKIKKFKKCWGELELRKLFRELIKNLKIKLFFH